MANRCGVVCVVHVDGFIAAVGQGHVQRALRLFAPTVDAYDGPETGAAAGAVGSAAHDCYERRLMRVPHRFIDVGDFAHHNKAAIPFESVAPYARTSFRGRSLMAAAVRCASDTTKLRRLGYG